MRVPSPHLLSILLAGALCACGGGGSNHAPTATTATITTAEDASSAAVTPSVEDPDVGDAHTFAVLDQPGRGVVKVVGNQLVYAPDADFSGSDSFPYRATDGGGQFVDGVCTVTVTPVNDAPISTRARMAVLAGTSTAAIVPYVADPDVGDTFSFAIVVPPPFGLATPVAGGLVFTAPAGVAGTTSFTYRATDSGGQSVTGTATMRVYGPVALALATGASTQNPDGTANRNRSEGCGHFATTVTRKTGDGAGGETDVTVDAMLHWPSAGVAPNAVAVLIAGSDLDPGIVGSDVTGEVTAAGSNFLVRSAQLIAEAGFLCVSLVRPTDRPTPGASDAVADIDAYRLTIDHAVDIVRAIEEINAQGLDVLIAGTSRGALSAGATNEPCSRVSFSGPVTAASGANPTRLWLSHPQQPRLQAGHVTTSAHVLWNALDACGVSTPAGALAWFDALTLSGNAATSSVVSGGFQDSSEANPCASRTHHGFLGIEPVAVTALAQWMDAFVAGLGSNRPPIAAPVAVATTMDTPKTIDLSSVARDPESDPLRYRLPYAETVRGGAASLTESVVQYVPPAGFTGTDRFVYVLTTPSGSRSAATVTVVVSPTPDPLLK